MGNIFNTIPSSGRVHGSGAAAPTKAPTTELGMGSKSFSELEANTGTSSSNIFDTISNTGRVHGSGATAPTTAPTADLGMGSKSISELDDNTGTTGSSSSTRNGSSGFEEARKDDTKKGIRFTRKRKSCHMCHGPCCTICDTTSVPAIHGSDDTGNGTAAEATEDVADMFLRVASEMKRRKVELSIAAATSARGDCAAAPATDAGAAADPGGIAAEQRQSPGVPTGASAV